MTWKTALSWVLIVALPILPSCGRSSDFAEGSVTHRKEKTFAEGAETANPKCNFVICVDPGHGVGDSGAISPFEQGEGAVYEKDITYAISLYLAEELRETGYTVVMARGSDAEEPIAGRDADGKCGIKQRVAYANAQEVDLYLCIHCDSFANEETKGTRLYYHQKNNGRVNQDLANSVSASLLLFSGVSPIIQSEADLYAVTATKMPAILIECGFLTNREDFADLTDSRWQQLFAKAVAEGADAFLWGSSDNS